MFSPVGREDMLRRIERRREFSPLDTFFHSGLESPRDSGCDIRAASLRERREELCRKHFCVL
jgi:hypothetical protein